MPRFAFLLALAAGLAAADPSADEAWRIGWPYLGGPTGNLLPLRTPTPLVEDLAQARLAWITSEADLGAAKTGSQTFAGSAEVEMRLGPDAVNPPGSWAAVVMADGRIFASTFQPAGPVFTAPYKTNRPYQKGETEQVPTRFRVAADDVVVCHDARDGRRLWIAREPGGVLLAGGKRGGFQVAPAVDAGKVFALGSTGRLFAYDAISGQRLWQSDIGTAHAAAAKALADGLARAAGGTMVLPGDPELFVSLVAVAGTVVASDGLGKGDDVGLIGFDAASGAARWRIPVCISRYATPSVWLCQGKAWLLCANDAGQLRLIDPQDGRVAWTLDGLGRNWSTLAPGARTVMVNVRPSGAKRSRTYGIWGAVRISPERAERAWSMPDEPRYGFSTWMDTGARQGAFVRDGRVLVPTQGTKEEPGRILLLDEETGTVLADAPQRAGLERMGEQIWWLGDRALVREDASHGSRHGGRHPIVGWTTMPGRIAIERDGDRIGGLDLTEFTTAYEVLMQPPLVDGRIFERTEDGRIACYDLRRVQDQRTFAVRLDGAQPGLPPLELRLWSDGPRIAGGKAWIPDSVAAGLPWGTQRRVALWQQAGCAGLRLADERITGTVEIDAVTHRFPIEIDLQIADDRITGSWLRAVPPLPAVAVAEGRITGRVSPERVFPTPWLKDMPWTAIGANPPGVLTWVLQCDGAVRIGEAPKGLTICLDHDGAAPTRAAAAAFGLCQAWHEVVAGGVRPVDGGLAGPLVVLANPDGWNRFNEGRPVAGRLDVQVRRQPDGSVEGTWSARWGEAWQGGGAAAGEAR